MRGFGVYSSGSRDLGFAVQGSGIWSLLFIQGSGTRGLLFRVQDLGIGGLGMADLDGQDRYRGALPIRKRPPP